MNDRPRDSRRNMIQLGPMTIKRRRKRNFIPFEAKGEEEEMKNTHRHTLMVSE